MKLKRREGKSRNVLITFFAPTLAIFFAAFIIFQSGILRPGGIWLKKPDKGAVITEDQVTLQFSVYSYTLLPLDRVEMLYWYEGINQRAWNKLCAFQPRNDKIYTCNFDLIKLKAPVGKKILVSFDAYGILTRESPIGGVLMNYTFGPDGWSCFYWQQKAVSNTCGKGYP